MSKTNENTNNNLHSVEKRSQEKHEIDNSLSNRPKSKLKIRESLLEKDKREKHYSCNANEVIFFKIINSKTEFEDYTNLKNVENTFNPLFTYQIFDDDEKITGYKNLKILISLTPVNLRPHVKIIFDDTLPIKDDLNLLLKNFYEEHFLCDETKFLESLDEELNYKIAPIGKKITNFTHNEKSFEVFFSDIKNDAGKSLSIFLQLLLPYFIEAANVIDIEDYFWHYFIIYEKNENEHYKLVGFCTLNHFHRDINKYRSMISQFIILNPYQRKGLGLKLLESIYDYYVSDSNCFEIVTEDPASEFILLRDIVLFSKVLQNEELFSFLKKTIKSIKEADNDKTIFDLSEAEFKNMKISKKEEKQIATKMKLEQVLINRMFLILKFIISKNKTELKNAFKKEVFEMLKNLDGASLNIQKFFKNRKEYGPHIYFHDEPNYKFKIEEVAQIFTAQQTTDDTFNHYYNVMEKQFSDISVKCQKTLCKQISEY